MGVKKKVKKNIFIISLLVVLFLMSGCIGREDYTTSNQTPYRVVDDAGETITYLKENHPEVQAIKALILERAKLNFGRDFRNTDGRESLHLHTHTFAEYLVAEGHINKLLERLDEFQMLTELIGVNDIQIRLNSAFTVADGTYTLKYKYMQMANDARKRHNKQLNVPYALDNYFLVVKEANLWKFNDSTTTEPVLIQ